MTSDFGNSWGRIKTPICTRVAVIDPELHPQIGLSAMQLDNLGLRHKGPPLNAETLVSLVENNVAGFPSSLDYPSIRARGEHEVELGVYNAFGIEGRRVRRPHFPGRR